MVGIGLASYGHFHRCQKAWKRDNEAEKRERQKALGKEHEESTSELAELQKTPSQILLDVADSYRSAYGPSVPPPTRLWQAFAMSESTQKRQTRMSKDSDQLKEQNSLDIEHSLKERSGDDMTLDGAN